MERTIAAVATPPGKGGISVIRISGEKAIEIAGKIFRGKIPLTEAMSHTINLGYINDEGEDIDRVLVSVMKAPKTYTGENVAEINCHGGIAVTRAVLNAVIKAGAYPAEPGEFTKRAFLNGKIDLSQAEAVTDIINAENTMARENAFGQLKGKLSQEIKDIRGQIINLSARMQVAIDYPDEDLEDITPEEIVNVLEDCLKTVEEMLKNSDNGELITEGIKVAIVGKPNVGKSSLLNRLARYERAIVTNIAGTTRDIIEERVETDGIVLRLIDTAGIRTTEDVVEKIGVERSKNAMDEADVLFVMLDASEGICREDRDILKASEGKNRIIIVNKTDISKIDVSEFSGEDLVEISAKTGEGTERLTALLKEKFNMGEICTSHLSVITNARHKAALLGARDDIKRAAEAIKGGLAQDLAALDIYGAANALGEITGETVSEDVVNEIFHNFCVGK